MEQHVITLFLSILIASAVAPPPATSKQYRSDYVYNKKTDAFYKLHIESVRAWRAREVCEVEGAKLMVPSSQQDIIQLHALFKKYPDLGEYVRVEYDGLTHESAEEQAIINLNPEDEQEGNYPSFATCDVVTRAGEVETYPCYTELPFMCKVEAKDAPYDPVCGVYATGYAKVNSKSGSCYKIPKIAYSWNQAKAECENEGAHLVILNSQQESDEVKQVMTLAPKVDGARASWFFFAGFRASSDESPRVFRTIFNQTLAEAGFERWAPNEPNNHQNSEFCGSLFKNDGNLNDLECSHEFAFICEKEVHL